MTKKSLVIIFLVFSFTSIVCSPGGKFPELTGSYLGQTPPGRTPVLFAPGVISTGMYERDVAMTPDGGELYYGLVFGRIVTVMHTRVVNGRWTEPSVAPFASDPDYFYFEPCLAPDGNTVYFLCTRPSAGQEPKPGWAHQNIWASNRQENGEWGEIYDVGPAVNTEEGEYFPSVTDDRTMYFTRSAPGGQPAVYRSRWSDDSFTEPEKLPEQVNGSGAPYNAFIARDESYLIACVTGRDDAVTPGSAEYYVYFRSPDDTWSNGVNMGELINAPGTRAFSPYVSPDGKYFFFATNKVDETLFSVQGGMTLGTIQEVYNTARNGNADIYWIDAGIIEELRPAKPE